MNQGRLTANWALRVGRSYLNGEMTFAKFLAELQSAWSIVEARFPDDDPDRSDVSAYLVPSFVTDVFGLCASIRDRRASESQLRVALRAWIPHLERGGRSWARRVRTGEWPIG